jgi:hypothetical protein
MLDKSQLPKRSDFPSEAEFVIKEFDVPLVHVPGEGWFNWFGGTPHRITPARCVSITTGLLRRSRNGLRSSPHQSQLNETAAEMLRGKGF